MVLKLHFYEYPKLFGALGHVFGRINAEYNFLARKAFLVSQFPDRSALSRFVARCINSITLLGGSFEFFGYCNAGIMLCLLAAARGNLMKFMAGVAPLHLWTMLLASVFQENTLGMLSRDAESLVMAIALVVGLPYAAAQAAHFHALSALLAGGGASLAWAGWDHLGADRFWYGAQLAPKELGPELLATVTTGPFAYLAHPWCLGCLVALLGLRLHPRFGATPEFKAAFWLLSIMHVVLLAAEVTGVHVPETTRYIATYVDFAK